MPVAILTVSHLFNFSPTNFTELEKLDEMEYDPMNLPLLGEKVLKEKRRKVQETLDRVMRLYQREDPELYAEMKTCQIDYEKKRKEKQVRELVIKLRYVCR